MSISVPVTEVIEEDLSLPGLEVQADGGFIEPPPSSAVATGDDEPENIEHLDFDPRDEIQELVDDVPPAPAPKAPTAAPKLLTTSPEYQRLVQRINGLEKRQRSSEKNVLILAALCALLFYQFQKQSKADLSEWDGPSADDLDFIE